MKRLIAVSDSHGCVENLRDAFLQARESGPIDVAVFLGDGVSDFDRVAPMLQMEGTLCFAVAGNNDYGAEEPKERVISVNGLRIFLCHGHTTKVKWGLQTLNYRAREEEAPIALYGHTHMADVCSEEGVLMANPGAICNRKPGRGAYIELKVENDGAFLWRQVAWRK